MWVEFRGTEEKVVRSGAMNKGAAAHWLLPSRCGKGLPLSAAANSHRGRQANAVRDRPPDDAPPRELPLEETYCLRHGTPPPLAASAATSPPLWPPSGP